MLYYYRCTFIFGTPTIYVDTISALEKLPPELQDNDINLAITGGASCSPSLMSKFKSMFPRAKILVF